jgi:methanogenic corrinoid protein MtbC1
MTASLATMDRVPPDAIHAFDALRDILVGQLDRQILGTESFSSLESLEEQGMPGAHGRIHFRFMSSVLRLGRPDLLALQVPWVYRFYRFRGIPEAFPHRFYRACRQAVGDVLLLPHARPILDYYDWLLENHDLFVRLSRSRDSWPGVWKEDRRVEAFTDLLLEGDARLCLRQVEPYAGNPQAFQAFLDQVLYPALHRLGCLWERAAVLEGEAHLATLLADRILAAFPLAGAPTLCRGRAVVCCPPGEAHGMGARMVAAALRGDGWEVVCLGRGVSHDALMGVLLREPPALLALSVGTLFSLGAACQLVEAVQAHPRLARTAVLAGGVAVNALPGLWEDLLAMGTARTAAAAASCWKPATREQK